MKEINPTKELQKRLYITFGFFVVSIVMGLFSLANPNWIGGAIVCLAFLMFNIFTTLYNLIVFSTKRIVGEEKCHSKT